MENNENKIIIEVTPYKHTTTVIIEGKVMTEVWKINSLGAERVSGDFENEKSIPEDMYYALEGFYKTDLMNSLHDIEPQ